MIEEIGVLFRVRDFLLGLSAAADLDRIENSPQHLGSSLASSGRCPSSALSGEVRVESGFVVGRWRGVFSRAARYLHGQKNSRARRITPELFPSKVRPSPIITINCVANGRTDRLHCRTRDFCSCYSYRTVNDRVGRVSWLGHGVTFRRPCLSA